MMQVRRNERGFTLVEVIVGVLIVAIVVAGVVYMARSAGESTQRNIVRQKMAAAAQKELEYRRSNPNTWVPTCKAVPVCYIAPNQQRYRSESSNDPDFQINATIEAIDSPTDDVGPNDKDQQIPDFYHVTLAVTLTKEDEQKFGKQRPFTTETTLDALALRGATGTLTVQACEVINQIDERMSFSSCGSGEQTLEMDKQPDPCEENKEMPAKERQDLIDKENKKFRLRCNEAWNEAKEKHKDDGKHTVKVKPSNVSFDIVPTGGTVSNIRSGKMHDSVSGDGSSFTYSNMAPGTYKIQVNVGNDKEIWKSHTIPSDLEVGVTANQKSRALIVVRPKQGEGEFKVRFKRDVYIYTIKSKSRTVSQTTSLGYYGSMNATTTYNYIYAERTKKETYDGPSWNAYIAMEPKPYDRYRIEAEGDENSNSQQYVHEVKWKEEPNDDATSDYNGNNNDDGVFIFSKDASKDSMPTGLYSVPEQLPSKREGYYGWNDSATDGRGDLMCGDKKCDEPEWFVWLDVQGKSESEFEYYDEEYGECYYQSSVPGYGSGTLTIMGGGEQPDSGEQGKDRCERDFEVNGTTIKDFFPGRDGEGGKTVLVRATKSTGCVPPAVCVPSTTGPVTNSPSGGSTTGYGGNHSSNSGQGAGGTSDGGSSGGESYSTGNFGGGASSSTPPASDSAGQDSGVSANGSVPEVPFIPDPAPTVVTTTQPCGLGLVPCPPIGGTNVPSGEQTGSGQMSTGATG